MIYITVDMAKYQLSIIFYINNIFSKFSFPVNCLNDNFGQSKLKVNDVLSLQPMRILTLRISICTPDLESTVRNV